MSRSRERESKQEHHNQFNEDGQRVCQRIGYVEKGTGQHQSNEVYSTDIARTLTHSDFKSPMKIIDEEIS